VLLDNGDNNTSVSADGAFGFSSLVASGSNYAVTILKQPAGQSCAVTNGSGTVIAGDIANVAISCSDDTYNVGVTASGVSASGLVLQDNGGDNLSIATNGRVNFNTPVASGSSYSVTVSSQPLGESCTVGNGSGAIISSNITNVVVSCTPNLYPISGSVAGLLAGESLVLQNNGANSTTVSGDGSFNFSAPVTSGSNYAVTILTQPAGQNCAVNNGSGRVGGNAVTNVSIACSDNTYNVGAIVSGVIRTGLVLQDNGADNLSVASDGSFNFNTPVASGSNYAVTILTQPAGESCLVTSGSGTVTNANISVAVTCTPNTYSIGGSVSGLSGSLVLLDNGIDNLTVSASGTFTFATPISSDASYAVTVLTQPAGQNCSIANGAGTVVAANVTSIVLTCLAANEWMWVGGSNTTDATGIYGTQGVAAAGNVPGARYYSVSWTDASGNLWLFGGAVYTAGGGALDYLHDLANDLWTFDSTARSWTWVSGPNTINTLESNVPGPRYSAVSWTDTSGDLWLFGGYGYNSVGNLSWFNDLWKFNPTSSTWIWISGSGADGFGIYGTQGVAAASNVPGARYLSVSCTDASGNLWLFGGAGNDSAGNYGALNDLWKFNPTAGTWTWVSGSDTIGAIAVYGTRGIAASGNTPGPSTDGALWADTSGNVWLLAGNYLWQFNPTAAAWTWVSGGNSAVYGTKGVAAVTNTPGARSESAYATDSAGNLWLFGGYGYDSGNAIGFLNDLWRFNPAAGTWTWVSGSNLVQSPGVYGTEGIQAATDAPGARYSPVLWTDLSGNLWLFGGYGLDSSGSVDTLNDLWEYVP